MGVIVVELLATMFAVDSNGEVGVAEGEAADEDEAIVPT